MTKKRYLIEVIRDEDEEYMPPHPYTVKQAQPIERFLDIMRNEAYGKNIRIRVVGVAVLDDGFIIIPPCGICGSTRHETPAHVVESRVTTNVPVDLKAAGVTRLSPKKLSSKKRRR